MVEIDGERSLAPACCRYPVVGMKVKSRSKRAMHSQKIVLELLMSDMPNYEKSPYSNESERDQWAKIMFVKKVMGPSKA